MYSIHRSIRILTASREKRDGLIFRVTVKSAMAGTLGLDP